MKIAVLGTGSMGETHASIYKDSHDIESVIIFGRNTQKTQEIAAALSIQASADISAILQDSSILAVDICLPTMLHKKYVVSALESNKHVFCEIPIAYNLKDAREMVNRAKEVNKVFQAALLMRSVAEINQIAQTVKTGALGKVLAVHAHRYQRYKVVDPIIDLMAFELDEVNYLLGIPESTLTSKSSRDGAEEYFAVLNYPSLSCSVEFKTIMSKDFPLSHGLRVICDEGLIETNTVFTGLNQSTPETSTVLYPKGGKKQELEIEGYDPYECECRYFIDTILGRVDGALLDANHAVDALRVAKAVKKSLEIGNEVCV